MYLIHFLIYKALVSLFEINLKFPHHPKRFLSVSANSLIISWQDKDDSNNEPYLQRSTEIFILITYELIF